MFEIEATEDGRIRLSGRLDASQVERARAVLATLSHSCTLDFSELEYISSLGLGVLLEAQKRLGETGCRLEVTNLSDHIDDLFRLAGFDQIFDVK